MLVKGKASVKVTFNVEVPIEQEFDPKVEGYIEAKEYILNKVYDELKWWTQYCEENSNSGADLVATRDFEDYDGDMYVEYDKELDDSFSALDKEYMRLEEEDDMRNKED